MKRPGKAYGKCWKTAAGIAGPRRKKQTLLMDYEMSLILASYLMGMRESRVTDCYIKNPEKILEILDDFSPLAEQKQIR